MLARLNADDRISATYLSSDGTQLLLLGAEGTTSEQVLEGCEAELKEANLRPLVQPHDQARSAWTKRDEDRDKWLAHDQLWKLSWREAETFADRIMVDLLREHGEGVRPLRTLLVESFFEGIRPAGEAGPAPTRWTRGATVEIRRSAILAEARRHLTEVQVAEINELLSDMERVRSLLRPTR